MEEDKLGMNSGEGFAAGMPEEARAARDRVARHLRNLDGIPQE